LNKYFIKKEKNNMSNQSAYTLIGAMSGTSLDGLDMALVSFWEENGGWQHKLHDFECVSFPTDLRERLSKSMEASSLELIRLDRDFGDWIGKTCKNFYEQSPIKHRKPVAVASHGYTVFHQPEQKLNYQIGCGQSIANVVRLPVVADFRTADILQGGQGAPLVPLGDHYLYAEYDFCLNLGGIANISFLKNNIRLAFDICPFNQVLNFFAEKLGAPYDDKGSWASQGEINKELLMQMNSLDFYSKKGVKSLGREWVDQEFLRFFGEGMDEKDALATSLVHFAMQIGQVIIENAPLERKANVLVTGGGAFNDYFIHLLQNLLEETGSIVLPGRQEIESKEAVIFAFLGLLRILKKSNSLASVTGARKDVCGGVVFLPS
jgi:anhydro-N-acetylmuramic acid kinase